ncbi:MFS transporter [Streptomyces sp. CMB-StM0423]|uniref:MFS transporter n=1 Tax=Streptomyces sp. CMB-StM0423 TaxID=2059884 RepID=UPI000C7062EB|nr:MFS transporter [Streptomyces sp. CMB-StM0423]AUH44790.1 MFS transporter [Streptomyces sp. CMB-StM0423]
MRSREFGLFFVARGIARLGDMMAPVALAAGLIMHGYGAGAVGLAMASMTACFAGFVIFGGVFADRFNARAVMIGADLARVGTQLAMAGLFLSGDVVLWQVCALSALNGTAAAMFQPGVAGIIPRIADDVQGANASIRTAESAMTLAGPAAAGALVGLTSPGGVYAAHAGTYAVSALCLALLRLPPRPADDAPPPRPPKGGRGRAFRADLAEGWREFSSRTWMWAVIAVWMVFMIGSWGPTVPLVAAEVVGEYGAGAYGVVNSVMGAGMVVGGLVAMRLRPARPLRAGAIAALGFGAQPAAVGLGLPVPAIAGAMAVAGAALAFWGVMWATSVQTQVPPAALSRVNAYEIAGSVAMLPVGNALAGPAAGAFGAHAVLVFSGALALLTACALLAVPAIRNLRRVDGVRKDPVKADTRRTDARMTDRSGEGKTG